ncbi:MAG: DHH family phosphoesterase [Candidatus Helarchaeota archaeon]
MDDIPEGFLEKARQLAVRLRSWVRDRPTLILGHRDGDGLSSASVILQALQALKFKKLTTRILLSPDIELLKEILNDKYYDYVITGDIGAGFEELLKEKVTDFIIADHHPNEIGIYGWHQLNACEFHMNDEIDCSGSTTAAMVFLHVFPQDFFLTAQGKVILCYAVAGAVSDFQMKDGPVSINKYITNFAVKTGAISMQKDICFFGRGMYPVYIALNRSGIPSFQDLEVCKMLVSEIIEQKDGDYWRRIIDLTNEEKAKLVEAIALHILSDANLDINTSEIIKGVVNYVYDLQGLGGWDCTLIADGRRTLDAREILHRVNYVSRRGKAHLALELLNNRVIGDDLWKIIENHHKTGDREVALALELYTSGRIPIESWDERVIMADFTGTIYYDEVGVVAGVIMKKFPSIEIMLSYCEIEEDNIVKLSTRAKEDIWNSIEINSNKLSDAKTVYHVIRKKYPTKIMQFGGHRWACSGYLKREILPEFFKEMVKYFQKLRLLSQKEEPSPEKTKTHPKEMIKPKSTKTKGQWKLDQFI